MSLCLVLLQFIEGKRRKHGMKVMVEFCNPLRVKQNSMDKTITSYSVATVA